MTLDDRATRIAVILVAHVIFLSGLALRLLRGERPHLLRAGAPWWLQYAPPIVWIPWVVALALDVLQVPVAAGVRVGGLVVAALGALFAAWAMWGLGRQYGIGMDLFAGHRVVTTGPYAIVRHPMYLGILVYHAGASVALGDLLLLAFTLLPVLPYLAYRAVAEERVLLRGLGEDYAAYARRVPALLPLPRP